MPTRKEIQWSQLRVGLLVLGATAVAIFLIFLMSASSGGMFSKKLVLRCYVQDAAGLKDGAPVTLQDVTIGNVTRIRLVPERKPNIVEVTMRVGHQYLNALHTDSAASIAQAGVLGDSYVHIDSTHAVGPQPRENAELPSAGSPSIQDVIRTSEDSIAEIHNLTKHIDTLVTTINSGKGTIGELVNSPEFAHKITAIATNLESVTDSIAQGKGTLGKMMVDDTLYNRANSTIDKLNKIATALDDGKGTAGKLLHDDSFYNNMNSAAANASQLAAEVNSGQGTLGKLTKDPAFAQKLEDTVTQLDALLKGVNGGQGTLGQLAQNRSLYDHADQTLDQAQKLFQAFRSNPKKYLTIQMKVF